MNRLTLSGGIRLDLQNESTEPFTAGPHKWAPNRNFNFPAVENVPNWKDINPRVSAAYDLFGNGKTAIKASVSRSVEQDSIRYADANNPASTIITSTNRTWTDANRNFVPDCNLTIGTLNGECGPWITPTFGTVQPGTVYSPAIMQGWGTRPYNWEFSTALQQQIAPRVSLNFGYYRRIQRQLLRDRQRGAGAERLHPVFGQVADQRRQQLHPAQRRTDRRRLLRSELHRRTQERDEDARQTSAISSSTGTATTSVSTRGCETACSSRAAWAWARR